MRPALRRLVPIAALVATFVGVDGAMAQKIGQRCSAAKLKAIGKKESGLLVCQFRVALRGDSSGLATCETKVMGKFTTAFGKAGMCDGDETSCETIADSCASAVAGALSDTFPSPCEAAKRKAAAKLSKAELGCYATATAKGIPLDVTCISRATGKFSAAITGAGTCPDGGAPQALVEEGCVQAVITTPGGLICPTTMLGTTSSTTSTTSTTTTTFPSCTSCSVCNTGCGNSGCADALGSCGLEHAGIVCAEISNLSCSGPPCGSDSDCGSGRVCIEFPYPYQLLPTCCSACPFTCDSSPAPMCGGTCPSSSICRLSSAGDSCACVCNPALPCPFVTTWGSMGSGDGQFQNPERVAVDGSGNVFVADAGNQRIEKFTNTGTFLTKWGSLGHGNGQFFDPLGVAVDGSGNVFVTDDNRIQKFTNTGTFLTTWGSFGSGDGQFSNPTGVAVDGSGNVFVADFSNNRIQKFTNSGTFLTKWGSMGSGDGQFQNPEGVAVDGSGNVFVADETNYRIQKFTNTGTFLTKWGSPGNGDGQFNYPVDVAIDRSGNVFVTDVSNERIQKFDNNGSVITKWGCPGSGAGQFNGPGGVAVDGSGDAFVAEFRNNRIQKFACP